LRISVNLFPGSSIATLTFVTTDGTTTELTGDGGTVFFLTAAAAAAAALTRLHSW